MYDWTELIRITDTNDNIIYHKEQHYNEYTTDMENFKSIIKEPIEQFCKSINFPYSYDEWTFMCSETVHPDDHYNEYISHPIDKNVHIHIYGTNPDIDYSDMTCTGIQFVDNSTVQLFQKICTENNLFPDINKMDWKTITIINKMDPWLD